jgi:hypothetical protein
MEEPINTELEKVLRIKEILQERATASGALPLPIQQEYARLRREHLAYGSLLPACVRNCRTIEEFWIYIRDDYATYQSRRQFLTREFTPLLNHIEGIPLESEQPLFTILRDGSEWEAVEREWRKACSRLARDPEGAITSARTLLETVCKHILDESHIDYKPTDSLINLYHKAADQLNLTPGQHEEESIKKLLGNSQAVVDALASLRNNHGDAHGKGRKGYRPQSRHAEFAVGLAGSIATFMIATWQQSKA